MEYYVPMKICVCICLYTYVYIFNILTCTHTFSFQIIITITYLMVWRLCPSLCHYNRFGINHVWHLIMFRGIDKKKKSSYKEKLFIIMNSERNLSMIQLSS